MPDGWWPQVRMDISEMDDYMEMIERARQAYFYCVTYLKFTLIINELRNFAFS